MGVWFIIKGDAYLVNIVYKCRHSGLQPLHHLPVLELWQKLPLYPVSHDLSTKVSEKPEFQFLLSSFYFSGSLGIISCVPSYFPLRDLLPSFWSKGPQAQNQNSSTD
jgi:hypothetical protein